VTAAPESAGAVPGGIRGAWAVLRLAAGQAREHRVPMIAQALAYSLFLAIPASLLVLLGIFSLVSDPSDVGQLVDRLESVMPAEAAELLGESLERSSRSTSGGVILTVIGFLLAVWTTTSAATALMEGITTAFGGADERGFVRKRLVALVIVACLVVASLLLVGLLVLGPHLERWLGDATGQQSLVGWLWWTAQWPILIVVLLFAFAVVLALGPSLDERPRIRVSAGSAVALAVWLAASGGLAVYSASFGSFEKTWGTLSAVVVTLVWLWLGGAALLLGAEIDAASRALRERPSPA
jgi:membrane protein